MKTTKQNQRVLTVDGFMTFIKWANGLHTADFECCEDVQVEPFTANCKVQAMRDGNVYISELPKRIHSKAMFRDDNCAFTHGRDGRYYFVFSMPEERLRELPQQLVRQAGTIAQKVIRKMMEG